MTEGIPTDLGERIPAQRAGRPEEVADAVAFLASERASYIPLQPCTSTAGFPPDHHERTQMAEPASIRSRR